MKKILSLFTVFIISFSVVTAQSWIRVNQIGYLEDDVKVGCVDKYDSRLITEFDLVDVASGSIVYSSDKVKQTDRSLLSIHLPDLISRVSTFLALTKSG